MKVVYTIPIRSGSNVDFPEGTKDLAVGKVTVRWKLGEHRHLEAVILEFKGADMRYDSKGVILPTYPELEEEAYRLANYVANRLFIQTAIDAIDPGNVLSGPPEIAPEDANEEKEFKSKPKLSYSSLKVCLSIQGTFSPDTYAQDFNHSAAHGYFADGLRAASIFQRFELLFKVVEYFFQERGADLDKAVSAYITPYDPSFTPPAVEVLRLLRNRSIHPRATKGSVNPQNIANVKKVHKRLPQIQNLAKLLLVHPTF